MSRFSTMAEVTAEQVQRGRGPDPTAVARRKLVTREVKSVRERLTSSTGLERAFDNELLRVFAEYRMNGSVGTLVLALAIAAAACLWVPVYKVTPWVGAVLLSTMLVVVMSRRFLAEPASGVAIRRWRRAFAVAEGLQGITWALMVVIFAQVDAPGAKVFVTTTLLIVSALTVMLAASIPMAVYAGIVPIMIGIAAFFWGRTDMDSLTTAVMAAAAQLFFVFLANRLYASSVSTIAFRAEKDALIAELETANANSDEARRKAEEANLAKSRFLATMSHELRTPLNAILGFSEVMKNEVFGEHANAAYKEYSGDIHGSGQHLLELINEILDLSRIEAGKYELHEEALSLADITEDCRHMLNLRAKAKSQTIGRRSSRTCPRSGPMSGQSDRSSSTSSRMRSSSRRRAARSPSRSAGRRMAGSMSRSPIPAPAFPRTRSRSSCRPSGAVRWRSRRPNRARASVSRSSRASSIFMAAASA